jgi:hypothetical protein
MKQIDVKPRGTSVGGRFLVAETLRRDRKPIGRALLDCTALDASYLGKNCAITLLTRDGQITAQGGGEDRPLPGSGGDPGTGDVFAITGGTGTYAGATGTLRVRSTRKGDRLTITLRRPRLSVSLDAQPSSSQEHSPSALPHRYQHDEPRTPGGRRRRAPAPTLCVRPSRSDPEPSLS